MTLGHSCSNLPSRMLETPECLALVAKAGKRWQWEQIPRRKNVRGQAVMTQASWRMVWVAKRQVKNESFGLGLGLGALPGCPRHWPSSTAGEAPRGQFRFSWDIEDPTWDGRGTGVCNPAKAKLRDNNDYTNVNTNRNNSCHRIIQYVKYEKQ
jgi:hypothetical protein